jgi:hypothetical protein
MYPEYLKLLFSRDSFLTCLKKVTQGITPEQSEYVTIAQVSHPQPKTLEIGIIEKLNYKLYFNFPKSIFIPTKKRLPGEMKSIF